MAYESTWAYGDYDLADIDTRLAEILLSAELTTWAVATDQTKDILLGRAVEVIEGLPFTGSKYDPEQTEAFPRVDAHGLAYDYDLDASAYVIPRAIYDAIALEAVAILGSVSSTQYDLVDDLQEHGVKSVRISGTGIQYEFTGTGKSAARGGMLSERAWQLVAKYLARDVMVI
jgi:hypothetical protein